MQDIEIRELNQEINPEFAFKVVMLGDSGVGKTSLVKYEIKNSFISENDSTIIFEHSFKNFSVMGKNVRLQIWDTCGKEMYRSSVQNFYRSALCIFVVFSLESLDSFNRVNEWIEEIKENNTEEYILVLLGNKSDLTPPRQVRREVIEEYCKNNSIENYFEASAKSGENVHEIFKTVVKQLFIKFALPIINENHEIKNEEKELPFGQKFFNQKIDRKTIEEIPQKEQMIDFSKFLLQFKSVDEIKDLTAIDLFDIDLKLLEQMKENCRKFTDVAAKISEEEEKMGQLEEAKSDQEFMQYLMTQYIKLQNNSINVDIAINTIDKIKSLQYNREGVKVYFKN